LDTQLRREISPTTLPPCFVVRKFFICFVCSFPFYFLFFLISARDKQANKFKTHVKARNSENTQLEGHATQITRDSGDMRLEGSAENYQTYSAPHLSRVSRDARNSHALLLRLLAINDWEENTDYIEVNTGADKEFETLEF